MTSPSQNPAPPSSTATYDRPAAGHSQPPLGARAPAVVSRTASHQHQHEQELLLRFAVPSPPVATKQLTLAAGHDAASTGPAAETPRTLWMGDLDPWLDEAAIVALWWHVLGQHVGVKVIRPRSARQGGADVAPPAHAGYCFVEFPLFEAAQQALGLNGQMLPDMAMPSQREFPDNPDNQKKYFRLNWAAGATLLAPLVELPEYSLFVGDLSAATTEAHLLLFFQKLFPNSIRTVRVMTDPVSGKSRCFGFVRFSDEHERQRALVEMNGAWFGGRPLRVANATPRAAPLLRRMLPDPRLAYAVPGPYAGVPDLPQGELMYMPPAQQGASSPMQGYYAAPMMGNEGPHAPYVDSGNTTVFVGGLLAEVSDQTLYTLFKPFGAIVQIKLPPGKNCGFVRYSSREEAQNAINSMEGFVIGGRRVRLGWGRIGPSNKKFQQHQQHQQQMAQMQMQAAMSLAYDPSSVYAAAGFPPMPGVPVGPPGMYHYLPSPELPVDYENGPPAEYALYSNAVPLMRSRSLDQVPDNSSVTGSNGNDHRDHLAEKLDTLSLDGPHAIPHGAFNPHNGYGCESPQTPKSPAADPAHASDLQVSGLSSGSEAKLPVNDSPDEVCEGNPAPASLGPEDTSTEPKSNPR